MRKLIRNRVLGAALLAFALVASACGDDGPGGGVPEGPTIKVSSFNFGESEILAEIYAQALEANAYPVGRQLNLGSREIVKPALESGEIDLVPEYVGTLLTFLGGTASSDSEATHADLVDAFGALGIAVLGFAPAQDKNGLVVTQETADDLGVTKTSDLVQYNGQLVFGAPPECPEREFCLIGLQDVYGLDFAEFKPLDVGGPLTVAALEGGEIDVALLFTTDGVIAAKGFVLLEDDRGLQPAENIVPVVRQEIVDAYGDDLVVLLDSISAKITTEELTELNRRAGIDQEDPADIAGDWLTDNGFIS
ncbi:MAG: ABC transporter substrate-binding protein [Acidimicrobiia bacterium]